MPTIHAKFKKGGKRFGVKFRGRLRGINRNLELHQYDGQEWNRLETESPRDATTVPSTGELTDQQLEQWGRDKADWYL